MKIQVKNNVTWVGKRDWELRKFHGDEYSTHRGSSYNTYLVREEKTALIDTVWAPFAKEYVANLSREIDLKSIDYVIANHAEIDHSGALPELMSRIPDMPIYCTANGVKSLKGHYHKDWNFKPVKTGDRLSLGAKELVFVEAPMLHWPDSMCATSPGTTSCSATTPSASTTPRAACSTTRWTRRSSIAECIKYYANILTPFSPLVTKKINEVLALRAAGGHDLHEPRRDLAGQSRRRSSSSIWNGRTRTGRTR